MRRWPNVALLCIMFAGLGLGHDSLHGEDDGNIARAGFDPGTGGRRAKTRLLNHLRLAMI